MKKTGKLILSVLCMLILLVDSKTAQNAASDAINLCIRSVIPSLFPFILASSVINRLLNSTDLHILRPVYTLCKVPPNCGTCLLLGILGGYPIGAKCINDAYKHGDLSKEDGHRLLGFCNNAGPAFIFGIVGSQFDSKLAAWTIWGIHILSALLVGIILPPCEEKAPNTKHIANTKTDILQSGIKTMSTICTWVVIFKLFLAYFYNWFLKDLPQFAQIAVAGILELTNGCVQLTGISNPGLRFVLASVLLSFGGVCVTMQTISVTRDIGYGKYVIGKALQTLICFVFSCCLQYLIFTPGQSVSIPAPFLLSFTLLLFFALFLPFCKKILAFPD